MRALAPLSAFLFAQFGRTCNARFRKPAVLPDLPGCYLLRQPLVREAYLDHFTHFACCSTTAYLIVIVIWRPSMAGIPMRASSCTGDGHQVMIDGNLVLQPGIVM
jgi:hypothetical protein